jgi:hypothetical protein
MRTRMNRELNFFITEDDDIQDRPNAARFAAKVPFEVRNTVMTLCTLIATLDQITALDGPPRPDREIEPRPCPPPW